MAAITSIPYEVSSAFAALNLCSSRRTATCSVSTRSDHAAVQGKNRIAASRCDSTRRRPPRVSAAATAALDSSVLLAPRPENDGVLFSETLDEWMRNSTAEIVRNLRRAPLLVQIYANDEGSAEKVETEEAVAEEWRAVTRRWEDGVAPQPDGVILVEELAGDGGEVAGDGGGEDGTRVWGMVVQGKGKACPPACYLMKTSRVGSGLGSGCTHFCLTKVEGFRESALSQLKNCWLLR